MVDEVDRTLKEWVLQTHPGIAISLNPPGRQPAGRGIGLYLFEMRHNPIGTKGKNTTRIEARYLVTAWSDEPEDAHALLVNLAFAPLPGEEAEMELDPVPSSLWSAFGVPPGPSLVVRVPIRQQRSKLAVPLVRQMFTLDVGTSVPFYGVILGPNSVPLADARLEIPSLQLSTTADYKGRFAFAGVPANGRLSLRARAKGHVLSLDVEGSFSDKGNPLLIHFTPLEN